MKTITINSEPISTNALYRGRRFLTKEGKEAKEAMAWEVASQWKEPITDQDIALNIIFYVKNNRRDLDNCLKATLDCLTGLIWKDDSQVVELHVYKEIDAANPRIEISFI
jgi:Holliday junction resolvase RusA-like endonuclease